MVLVKDPDSTVFKTRYQPNYRVTAIFGDNRIEVQDEKGHKSVCRSSHVKYVEPSDKLVQQLPSREVLQNYGRSSKLLIPAKDITDLQFKLKGKENNSDFEEEWENSSRKMAEVVEVKEGDVLPDGVNTVQKKSQVSSETHESLIKLWKETAGVALRAHRLGTKFHIKLQRKHSKTASSQKIRHTMQQV